MQSKISRLIAFSLIGTITLIIAGCGSSNTIPEVPTSLPPTAPISVPSEGQPGAAPQPATGPGGNEPTTPLVTMGGSATTVDPRFYQFELEGIPALPRVTERNPCNSAESTPTWVSRFNGGTENILTRTDPGRNRLEWCACGLPNQEISALLLFPDEFELEPLISFNETDSNICAELRYSYPIDTPPGSYQMTITDAEENMLLSDIVTLEAPTEAVADWVGKDVVWIAGFQPNETVLLRYFELVEQRSVDGNERHYVSYSLVDQQNATVGADGSLIAQIDVFPVGVNVDPTKILSVAGSSATTYTCNPECGVPRGEKPDFEDAIYVSEVVRTTTISNVTICEPVALRACNDQRVISEQADEVLVKFEYTGAPASATFQQNWAWRPLGDQGVFDTWVEYKDCQLSEPGSGENTLSLTAPEGLRSGEWLVTVSDGEFILLQEVFVVEGTYNEWRPPSDNQPCPVPETG